jgi:hypothetical protein
VIGWPMTWLGVCLAAGVEITTCTMGSTDSWLVSAVLWTPLAVLGLVAILR